jgi:hypothetical protein
MNAGFESCHLEFREIVFNPELEQLTTELKDMGQKLAPMGMSREAYIEKNATNSILFLIDVQKWKSLHFGKRGDFLQLDTPESIAGTFFDFFHEKTDYEKIQTLRRITRLGHNGSSQMERYELKKASIMAQFLDPMEWGLLDWSTMRMPGQASSTAPRLFYEPVSELMIQRSLEFIRSKRCPEYPQALDVGLALFTGVLE